MSLAVSNEFEARGYVILRGLIDRSQAQFLSGYAVRMVQMGQTLSDRLVPDTPAGYGAPLMEKLMLKLLPAIEKASGRSLYPTYTYFRVYKSGDVLTKHKDRPACEISVSLCVGYQAPAPWPLFVEGTAGVCAAELNEGDGLLYKGSECPHWREPFVGEYAAQVFLHYVDRFGPYSAWRFDKRTGTGV